MNKRRERYCTLRTIGEVQAERAKLRRTKRANEKHLAEDWDDVVFEFSPANLFHKALGKLACSSPVFGNVIAGVKAAASLFSGKRRDHGCGCE